MKKVLLLTMCLALILISDLVDSQKTEKIVKKRRKIVERRPTPVAEETLVPEESLVDLEAKVKVLSEQEGESANEIPVDSPSRQSEDSQQDPCVDKRCGPGRECVSTELEKAKCVCMATCPSEEDNRRRVCSNYNETWTSDCELYRSRCLCDESTDDCVNPLNKHLHIEYYGECREMAPCSPEEMSDFPRRMRDWLFNVMRELADRRELSPHYLQMEREAERSTNESQRSVVAAVWKWCDLDGHPHDRKVSRHELFPIRAPLMALEHCIAPFLDNCDSDNDHRITLQEWGNCLEVPKEKMLEKCDDVREGSEMEEGEEEV